jgi:hypothetical protein
LAIVRHFFYCLLISISLDLLNSLDAAATQVKAVSSLLFPALPILQGTVMVAHNPTSQPQLSSSTTHHQRPDTADTSSSSPTFPLLSILNIDYVMMPLSPMEPMEFREVCRWNNNGNSDDVFGGESYQNAKIRRMRYCIGSGDYCYYAELEGSYGVGSVRKNACGV